MVLRRVIVLLFTRRRVRRIDLQPPPIAASADSWPPSSHREIEPSPRPLPDQELIISPYQSPRNPISFSVETLAGSPFKGPRRAISLFLTRWRSRHIDLQPPPVAAASGSGPPSSYRDIEPSPRPLPDPELTISPSSHLHFFRSPEMCPQTASGFFARRDYHKTPVLPELFAGEEEEDDDQSEDVDNEPDQIGTLPATLDNDFLMPNKYSGTVCIILKDQEAIEWTTDSRTITSTEIPFGDKFLQIGYFLRTDEAEKSFFVSDFIAACFSGEESFALRYLNFMKDKVSGQVDVTLEDMVEITEGGLPFNLPVYECSVMLMDRRLVSTNFLLINFQEKKFSLHMLDGNLHTMGVGAVWARIQIYKLVGFDPNRDSGSISFSEKLTAYLDSSKCNKRKFHGTAVLNAALNELSCGGHFETYRGSPSEQFKMIYRGPVVSLLNEFKDDVEKDKLPYLAPYNKFGFKLQMQALGYAYRRTGFSDVDIPANLKPYILKTKPNPSNYTVRDYLTGTNMHCCSLMIVPSVNNFLATLHGETKDQDQDQDQDQAS